MRITQDKDIALHSGSITQPDTVKTLHGIKAGLLIPGRGEPLKNGVVVIKDNKIEYVCHEAELPSRYSSIPFRTVPVLMPGMWDCHVHFGGEGSKSKELFGSSPALCGARVANDFKKTILAGFTSVRELAGFGGDVFPAVKEGTIIGPHVYSSICILSMTAGHGDIHTEPLASIETACRMTYPFQLCDGVDECIKAVRLQLRRGAKVIKICASGGVGSELDDPEDRQFSDAELKAIVEEAGRAKRIVAAHCHGKAGIIAALKAGCKTIEHGSYLDEEAIAVMKEHDAILVATRSIQEGGLKMRDAWSPASYAKLLKVAKANKEAYELAIKLGVRVALGTDLGFSDDDTILSHGKNGKELSYAVDAGLTPLQAIEACTATAPETLGPQAPLSGLLKKGYDADLIAIRGNPLEDIGILAEPNNITHVWKDGKLFKSMET